MLASCNFGGGDTSSSVKTPPNSSEEAPKTYKVTFKQAGEEDVVMEVQEGEDITAAEMPTPKAKTGYTVAWEVNSLTNIKADTVVNVVETANVYTITYDADGGEVTPQTQKATYDNEVALPFPRKDGFTFQGWKLADGTVVLSGPWTIANDVTLKAEWKAIDPEAETVTVTFNQKDQQPVIIELEKGAAVTEAQIPAIIPVKGYNVAWEETAYEKLSNVTEDLVVNTVMTAKTFTVTVDGNGGNVPSTTMTITYNTDYTLTVTEPEGYTFDKWTLPDGTEIAASGKWQVDMENITVKANWKANKYTVSLNAAGGSVSQATIEVTYGETYNLPTPTRDGYMFLGWYQGDVKVELSGTWTRTGASIELKAKWAGEWTNNY